MNKANAAEILLVEDNINDAELTIRALKKNNLVNKLVHVKDGKEALDFLYAKDYPGDVKKYFYPKIILLDLKLPKVDGLEVLKKVKENEATKGIPVIVLTSSKEEKDLVESYRLGVNSYIVKPVDFDEFTESIAEVGLYWLVINQLPTTY